MFDTLVFVTGLILRSSTQDLILFPADLRKERDRKGAELRHESCQQVECTIPPKARKR